MRRPCSRLIETLDHPVFDLGYQQLDPIVRRARLEHDPSMGYSSTDGSISQD
jgi:hypothetical protein